MILPEIILKKVIDFILNEIDSEYLSILFEGEKINNYDFYENAVSIFLKKKDNPRVIESHLFFNKDRAFLPTIHINLPSDNHSGDNSNMVDFEEKFETESSLNYRKISNRSYQSKFNIIFTSDNTFEVNIMYNTFKAVLQGNMYLLEQNGIRNAKLSGNDIVFSDGMMPIGIYAKALTIDGIYTFKAPSIKKYSAVTGIVVE